MGNVIVTPVILETIVNQLLNLICIMIYLMWLPDFFLFFLMSTNFMWFNCVCWLGHGLHASHKPHCMVLMECGTSELWTNQKHDIHNSTGQVKYNWAFGSLEQGIGADFLRAYLSNVCVAKELHRNGLGYSLVAKSKIVAQDWGKNSPCVFTFTVIALTKHHSCMLLVCW